MAARPLATPARAHPLRADRLHRHDAPIPDRRLPGIERWSHRSRCLLGVGDGDGLNYVTTDPRIEALVAEAGF